MLWSPNRHNSALSHRKPCWLPVLCAPLGLPPPSSATGSGGFRPPHLALSSRKAATAPAWLLRRSCSVLFDRETKSGPGWVRFNLFWGSCSERGRRLRLLHNPKRKKERPCMIKVAAFRGERGRDRKPPLPVADEGGWRSNEATSAGSRGELPARLCRIVTGFGLQSVPLAKPPPPITSARWCSGGSGSPRAGYRSCNRGTFWWWEPPGLPASCRWSSAC